MFVKGNPVNCGPENMLLEMMGKFVHKSCGCIRSLLTTLTYLLTLSSLSNFACFDMSSTESASQGFCYLLAQRKWFHDRNNCSRTHLL